MNMIHTKSGGVYEVRHATATWLPGTATAADNADLLVMRRDLEGDVFVQLAADPIPAGYSVISGAILQKAPETKLTRRTTMVIYANSEGNQFGRELHEFNAKFKTKEQAAADAQAAQAAPTTDTPAAEDPASNTDGGNDTASGSAGD